MKKKVTKVKKLLLSRETLRDLENSGARKALGGNEGPTSVQSQFDKTCCDGPTTRPDGECGAVGR